MANKGFKVGIVDLDICGPSINGMMKIKDPTIVMTNWGWKPCESPHYKIKVVSVASLLGSKENAVIYKGPRKTNLIKKILKETYWGRLDYLIFDTPPGTSDEHLTIIKFLKTLKLDGALLVSTPQKLSVNCLRREITFCRKMRLNVIGLIENMSYLKCSCCNEKTQLFPKNECKEIADLNKIEFLGDMPFNKGICKYFDDFEKTEQNTDLLDIINPFVETIMNLIKK